MGPELIPGLQTASVVAECLQYVPGYRRGRGSNSGTAIMYAIGLISWADVASDVV